MFITAIISNLLSSYLIASIFGNFLIVFVAFFALVVLNMEFLSLFSAMNELNVLIFSFINLAFSVLFFKLKKVKLLKPNFDFIRLKNALLLDKSLIVLFFAFFVMFFANFFLAIVMPVLEPDSQTYHFIRAYEYVSQGSLAHFETNDIRALVMPINSEILYSWMLMFKKNFHGYGIVSFSAFILIICSLWSVFEKFKFSFRKRLYAIFLLSSLSAIIIQMPSLQTDLLVGALLICAFSLYIKNSIYFSSLSLALAFGVKSTGVIALVAFFASIILYEVLINKNKNFSKIKKFGLLLVMNFLIFSSYNYFLNLFQFHNPLANRAAYLGHKFWGGLEGYIANLIHFAFQSLDFTGFKWGYYLNNEILNAKEQFFDFLHINSQIGCNVSQEKINIITDEQTIGFGILGFLVFLPMVFISIFKFFFNKNKRTILCFIFAVAFLINILLLARTTAYMVYSIRFIVAFVCFSSVILVAVYKRKSFIKIIILFFCLFYMLLIPLHNKRMPFKTVFNSFKNANFDLNQLEKDAYEKKVVRVLEIAPAIYKNIKEKYPNKKNIAIIKSLSSSMLYLKKLEYEGYNIDFVPVGKLTNEKLEQYDLIILEDLVQNDNIFNPEEININYEIKNNNLIFKSSKVLNCYYEFSSFKQNTYIDDALRRHCFSYQFLKLNKNLRLDLSEKIKLEESNGEIEIFYFINTKKG